MPGEGPADAMSFSPDGTLLVAANHDGSVEIWDTAAGRRAARFAAGRAHPVALVIDSDNDRFAIAYEDGYVQVATTEGAMLTGFQASSEIRLRIGIP